MDDRSDSLAEMNRLEPEFKAVFGDTEAFSIIREQMHNIRVTATMMLEGERSAENSKVIYAGSKEDIIKNNINEALLEIEKICIPILSGKKK